ncbi:response regulator [Desulforegula conservatrix]|uniref:response regulator n=1 Tax=Desulforegula conservatrix TaxID=153026 RepID=UPI0004020BB7|nr:response regulator [Desulforegula conservatrix]
MDEFKVLIVDDEDDFRETIVKRLKSRKIVAEGAEDGKKALELINDNVFDVIVLDVKMPGMDGIETLRRIKAKNPQIEVIMLTGHASVDFGIKGMQLGAFDYVMKPAPLHDLLDKIRQAYDKKKGLVS